MKTDAQVLAEIRQLQASLKRLVDSNAKPHGWICAADKLPPLEQRIIACMPPGFIQFMDSSIFYRLAKNRHIDELSVMYWRDAPTPPPLTAYLRA